MSLARIVTVGVFMLAVMGSGAVVAWQTPRRLSRAGRVVLILAAVYAAIDVVMAVTLPRLLWADSGWSWLAPRWVWHPLVAAQYVADGQFLVLYEAPAVGDPAGYYYMPLGPVFFAGVVAIGDTLDSLGGLLLLMVGWGAFWAAAAVALGAYRLAGPSGAVTALMAGKAMMFGWANLDLLVAGLLLLAISATGAGQRGVWTGAALMTKQIAGALAIPLLISRMRSRRFLIAAVAAPTLLVLMMVAAAPSATLEAVSAQRNANSWSPEASCDDCRYRFPAALLPGVVSLMQSWVLWVVTAVLLSWWFRDRIRTDGHALLAVVTAIAVIRTLIGVVVHGAEPHHWAVAVVCAALLAEMNRDSAARWNIGGWGVVTASVVLRYWYQDYAALPSDWWTLDPFGMRWRGSDSPPQQTVMWLAVVVPCATVFLWPAASVLLRRDPRKGSPPQEQQVPIRVQPSR